MAFPSKSPVSSVHTPSEGNVLNANFVPGDRDIDISAYMRTENGEHNETNCDNYYMNGIYMKTFRYTDMKKSVENTGTSAVFAVSHGVSSEFASKELFKYLDSRRDWIVSAKTVGGVKKRLKSVIVECNNCLRNFSQRTGTSYAASMLIAVFFRDQVLYSVCGNGVMFFLKGNRVKFNSQFNPYLGSDVLFNVNVMKKKISKGERVVMCTNTGVPFDVSQNLVYSIIDRITPKEIVQGLFDKLQYYKQNDLTCMAISASPTIGLTTKTILIAAVCLIVSVINAVLLICR